MTFAVPPSSEAGRTLESSRVHALVALAVVAVGVAARLWLGDRPLDYDSANYAYVATRMIDEGSGPLALFNNKPPGIYYWYVACFTAFGNGPLACHLTSIIPDLFVIFAVARLGRRLGGELAGAAAAGLYATLAAAVRLSGYGYTESPVAALAMLAALFLTGRSDSSLKFVRACAAGIALGVASLFKQPALLVALGLLVWTSSRREESRRGRVVALFCVGFLLVQAVLFAWLARTGQVHVYVQRTFLQGLSRGYAGGLDVSHRVSEWWRVVVLPLSLVLPLGLVALVSPSCRGTRGVAAALVVPILVMSLVSYELYDHYLIPALPGLCLAAGEWLATRPPGWRARLAWSTTALVQCVSLLVFLTDCPPRGSRVEPLLAGWRARPLTLSYQLRVAAFVAATTAPNEPILSTGSEIPYLAHRRNAYRFLGVAPYLARLDAVGFTDFPAAAAGVRVLVLERWRLGLLPEPWVADLDSPSGPWQRVTELDHPEFLVYRRRDFGQPSAILDFPRAGP